MENILSSNLYYFLVVLGEDFFHGIKRILFPKFLLL